MSKNPKKNTSVQKRKLHVKQEVIRNLNEDFGPFASNFYQTLVEDQLPPDEITPEGDAEAFEGALEPGTDGEDFETEGPAPGVQTSYVKKAKEWITKMDEFSDWLNNVDSDSLNKQLNEIDRPGSLFQGISRKASDNLVKVAGEISRLKEVIEGYVLGAPKKQREQQSKSGNFS